MAYQQEVKGRVFIFQYGCAPFTSRGMVITHYIGVMQNNYIKDRLEILELFEGILISTNFNPI